MKKTLTWITWLSLSAVSPIALAVGLGQASVSSYLDAPLDASIPLLESSDYALDDIRVSVAEQSAFASAGLEWTPLAASVRVQVQEQQGRRQVSLMSEQPMVEPWLELLFTIEYPGGQQSRDVTLLFDPPGYSQQGYSQPTSPQQAQTQTAVVPPAVDEPRPAVPTNVSGRDNGSSAYVGSGDTLWGVAERIKPDEVSVQQMMVALLEANPGVFSSGNINDMRAGQTLRVPGVERILARSHDDADAAIKAMNEAWRNRRNGSLQTVALPQVDAVAPVSDTSIAAAQALQANEPSNPDSALAAGGSEAVDQAALEEGGDEPEALTRAELTEQLRLSQATLQQVLEERELMRAELNELRGEVASLTQALSDALAAQEQTPAPLVASMDETNNPGVAALIERYQWPLALAAIALLVALLVWLRKRREETWEDVPVTEPVVRPTVAPSAAPKATSMPEAVPVTFPAQPNAGDVDEPHHDSGQSTASQSEPEPEELESEPAAESDAPASNAAPTLDTDQWLVDDQGLTPSQDDTLRYEKSQASGLAEQGRQRRLHAVSDDSSEKVSLAPPPSSMPMSQLLASLSAGVPSTEPAADAAHMQPTEKSPEAAADPGHRFIDYHPPILNSTTSSALNSQSGLRTETPMQPTVEFSSEPHADPVPPAKQPSRPTEEEWEIEEVAFKPRGLDNSDPSKSSK